MNLNKIHITNIVNDFAKTEIDNISPYISNKFAMKVEIPGLSQEQLDILNREYTVIMVSEVSNEAYKGLQFAARINRFLKLSS